MTVLRRSLLFVAIWTFVFLFSGCESKEKSHDFGDNDPNLVLAVGDSITAGYGVLANQSYPYQLEQMTGLHVINGGRSGALSWEGLNMFESHVRRSKPGYVLILFGANDVSYRQTQNTPNHLLAIANRARELQMIPVIGTLLPAYRDDAHNNETKLLNQRIRKIARENGIRLADIERDFGNNRDLISVDGLHPTPEGMRLIAISFMMRISIR